ncbi:Cleavage and polyadenylation specificity factor subunit 4 [Aphelenchoides besseyi]|nr:Cleavage and polyadenylation specificity factor subunit 4 [Aphelenchoides besseyi]
MYSNKMPSGQDVIDDLTMEYKISRCLYNITDVEMMLIEQRGCKEVPFSGMDKSGHSACVKFTQGQCSLGAHCPLRHLVGDKQVVCKHWLRGLCKKGDQCEFLHEYDMSKMPECYFFSKFMSCSNRECPFRHIDPESKIKDCPWYDRGFCRHGPFCKHRHRRRVVCPNYLCGFCPDGKECKFTHPSFNIPTFDPKASGNTRVSASIMCHNCHERGHKATNCPHLPSGAQIPQLNQNLDETNRALAFLSNKQIFSYRRLPSQRLAKTTRRPKAKRVKKLLKNQRNSTAPIGNGNSIRNGVCGTKVEKTKTQMNGTSAKEETPPEPNEENGQSKACCSIKDLKQAHHRKDMAEIINLIPADDTPPIFRSFIRLSVFATITTLKRTLACTLRSGNISHYNDYDIFCNDELMGRDFSMMFIRKTRWRDHSQDEPLRLVYKLHKEF